MDFGRFRLIRVVAAAWLSIVALLCVDARADLAVTHGANAEAIPRYEAFELTFHHGKSYDDPFHDVSIAVRFVGPNGVRREVGGFHYGSLDPPEIEASGEGANRRVEYVYSRADVWKARFAPHAVGRWEYEYTFANARGEAATGAGSFECVEALPGARGPIRPTAENPYRWATADGAPYFPIGLQECIGDGDGTGTALDGASLEGPFRTDRTGLVQLPPGPMYVRGPSENPQNADIYFRRYAQAGFNLFRFSQANCSYPLFGDLDHYLTHEAVMTDELLKHARKYGFRVMYGLFGFAKAHNDEPDDDDAMESVNRFVEYSVNRWGAYVDIWQILNEQKSTDPWHDIVVGHLRSVDPYDRPVTTSWQRPELDQIDINAPHWYQNEDELRSDAVTAERAAKWKQHGKPVIVGEQGNYVDPNKERPIGVGGTWDAGSARRMRLRIWSAFFNEIALVFWNTSYARDGHFMNIWLGPREREYVRALQSFANSLGEGTRMTEVAVSDPDVVRAYGLTSDTRVGVYLHHFAGHAAPVEHAEVSLQAPVAATAYWYDPGSARILDSRDVESGAVTLAAPPFVVDIALLITPDGPPDVDGDGVPPGEDLDSDNDGVDDSEDAFPLDPSEWIDADGDLIGDNMDADDNGDGVGDDKDANGIADHEEMDFDGDGVPRSRAIPWDAFPFDATEWADTDGDGVGDNADDDDDGDGYADAEEARAASDPADRLSVPAAGRRR